MVFMFHQKIQVACSLTLEYDYNKSCQIKGLCDKCFLCIVSDPHKILQGRWFYPLPTSFIFSSEASEAQKGKVTCPVWVCSFK